MLVFTAVRTTEGFLMMGALGTKTNGIAQGSCKFHPDPRARSYLSRFAKGALFGPPAILGAALKTTVELSTRQTKWETLRSWAVRSSPATSFHSWRLKFGLPTTKPTPKRSKSLRTWMAELKSWRLSQHALQRVHLDGIPQRCAGAVTLHQAHLGRLGRRLGARCRSIGLAKVEWPNLPE